MKFKEYLIYENILKENEYVEFVFNFNLDENMMYKSTLGQERYKVKLKSSCRVGAILNTLKSKSLTKLGSFSINDFKEESGTLILYIKAFLHNTKTPKKVVSDAFIDAANNSKLEYITIG